METISYFFIIFAYVILLQVASIPLFGKMAGAVGNYNAHISAYPNVNWQSEAEKFVRSLDLHWNPYVTQVILL